MTWLCHAIFKQIVWILIENYTKDQTFAKVFPPSFN